MHYNVIMQNVGTNYSGKIAAFVSGGVDSMVMLDLLIKAKADVFVVHVNHGIRQEAVSDCAFVEDFCNKIGVPFFKFGFDIPALAEKSGRSIETEARIARHSVIDEIIRCGKADKAALAHHADDNAETVLMHILRGSGLDGLKGIEESDRIIRPLLSYTRKDILEYAEKHNIPYVEDKTNFDTDYTRNFIRHEVLPLIKTRYPGAVEALNRLASNVAADVAVLNDMLDLSLIKEDDGLLKLSISALDSPLAARYVINVAKRLMPVDITRAQIENVISLKNCKPGSKAELAGGLKAYKEYDVITFCFEQEKSLNLCVPFEVGTFDCMGSKLTVKEVPPSPVKGKTIIGAPLPDGCVFRHRCDGDKFTPYGGHSKNLKKYLIDKKVPRRIRDNLICLCNGSEVLAIVGLEISDKCKITADTKSAYLITKEELYEN